MSDEEHVIDLLPAYSLNSLDGAEAQLVAEHLRSCYLCRSELSALQDLAAQVALVAPVEIPSDSLKARLMERIRVQDSRNSQPARWRFEKRLLPIAGIISVLLIITLAISNLLLWQRLNHLEVLTGPLGMRAIALRNTDAAPEASGFVIMGADGQNGVLVVDQLPYLDNQREYQLWLVRNGESTSGAVFSVDEEGYRGMRIEAPETLLLYSSVRVTIEPVGGSAAPTGEQVLAGSLFNP